MADITKVALDAMGGDNAPVEMIKGAVEATEKSRMMCRVLLSRKRRACDNAELDKVYL